MAWAARFPSPARRALAQPFREECKRFPGNLALVLLQVRKRKISLDTSLPPVYSSIALDLFAKRPTGEHHDLPLR